MRIIGFVGGAFLATVLLTTVLFRDPAAHKTTQPTAPDDAGHQPSHDQSNNKPAIEQLPQVPARQPRKPVVKQPDDKAEPQKPSEDKQTAEPPSQSAVPGQPVALVARQDVLPALPTGPEEQPPHVVKTFAVGQFNSLDIRGLAWLNEQLRNESAQTAEYEGVAFEKRQTQNRTHLTLGKQNIPLCEFWLAPTQVQFRWSYVAEPVFRRCQQWVRLAILELRVTDGGSLRCALHPFVERDFFSFDKSFNAQIPANSIPLSDDIRYPIFLGKGVLQAGRTGDFPFGQRSTSDVSSYSLPNLAHKLSLEVARLTIEPDGIVLHLEPERDAFVSAIARLEKELGELDRWLTAFHAATATQKEKEQSIARLAQCLTIAPIDVKNYRKDGTLDVDAFAKAINERSTRILETAEEQKKSAPVQLKTLKSKQNAVEQGYEALSEQVKLRATIYRVVDGIRVDLIRPASSSGSDGS